MKSHIGPSIKNEMVYEKRLAPLNKYDASRWKNVFEPESDNIILVQGQWAAATVIGGLISILVMQC